MTMEDRMKRMVNSERFVFTALQVCSVVAMIFGLGETMSLSPGASAILPAMIYALWCAMWVSFLRMCGRLKRESSAFTEANARTLMVIAVCCAAAGIIMVVEALVTSAGMVRGLLLGGWLGGLATEAIFFGVAAVALVLRRLLKSAMALQQDSDLTI